MCFTCQIKKRTKKEEKLYFFFILIQGEDPLCKHGSLTNLAWLRGTLIYPSCEAARRKRKKNMNGEHVL